MCVSLSSATYNRDVSEADKPAHQWTAVSTLGGVGVNVNANITLSVPAIEKLVDYLASGVGAVGGTMLASWRARKEAEARLIDSHGEAAAQRILTAVQTERLRAYSIAQSEARKLLVSPDSAVQGELDIDDMISTRIKFQEQKRHQNIKAVVEQAALELGDKRVENREPDHDWSARFFNEVQDVSSEEMQLLWSKVLAGEVERPGSTSIRTLSILRNLDKVAAKIFRTLASACISLRVGHGAILDAMAPSLGKSAAHNALKEYGLDFDALNALNEHGLIISDYNSWRDYSVSVGVRFVGSSETVGFAPFRFQRGAFAFVPTKDRLDASEFKVSGVSLSQAGLELARVIDEAPMVEYARAMETFFASQNMSMKPIR